MIETQPFEIRQTAIFQDWMASLKDKRAAVRIAQRIVRVQSGLLGDIKPVGDGVAELRIDHGPGYRVYLIQKGRTLIILLCGGDKGTQAKDIVTAKAMALQLQQTEEGR
jgi:putative addiction module killer protein